ncbi:DUF3306 domain-containing protein [Candidatus Puniceispirillum sp.]|nr:DUF3306 domain-containing protein [Candidatus Puniceispirillum sp.]
MDRPTKQDKKKSDDSFLSRWSARKAQIAKGELVADEKPDPALKEVNEGELDNDEEAKLSDQELLEKYELPDPEDLADESDLTQFLGGDLPERLRQMALRRLWRLNPLFGHVCDMVEYGEDYTDAATVMEGMQTAYQVGKGYETKASDIDEAEDNEIADTEAEDNEIADTEAEDNEIVDTEAEESKIVEIETLDSEVEAEQLDEKTNDEYDDGAVFKDNAIGIGGTGAPEYILPVNDISVPYVSKAEKKETETAPGEQPAGKVATVEDITPSPDVSKENENDEVTSKLGLVEQNPKTPVRPSRMRFIRSKTGS